MKQLSLGESGFERLGLEDAQARVPRRDEPGRALGGAGVADRSAGNRGQIKINLGKVCTTSAAAQVDT